MLKLVLPPMLCMLMGFAMQRGSTCCLRAVFEFLHARQGTRLVSIAEAALWVLAVSGLVEAGGVAIGWPSFARITLATVAGGLLLGLGAFVNRACVIGTVARIGAGEWAYLWTPVGFFAACVAVAELGILPQPQLLPPGPADRRFVAALIASAAAIALVVWRISRRSARPPSEPHAEATCPHTWAPHTATIVIGIAFSALLAIAGGWSYTDLLQAAARHADLRLAERGSWFLCLLAGAIIGGSTAGLLKPAWPTLRSQMQCFSGGALLGLGSLSVPGGNDALVLLGIPMLSASAWVATAAMFVTMAAALTVHLRRAA